VGKIAFGWMSQNEKGGVLLVGSSRINRINNYSKS
jgi:hypothetical protein